MWIRSAVGDDDRVTTTFAQCGRALSTAGTAQQRLLAHHWTSCAVYPFAFTPMPVVDPFDTTRVGDPLRPISEVGTARAKTDPKDGRARRGHRDAQLA